MAYDNAPYGGELVDLMVSDDEKQQIKDEIHAYKSFDLSHRQLCDIELLLNGGFSPLRSFLGELDYKSVVESMRLADGTVWPMPITLDVSSEFASTLAAGEPVALRDPEGVALAVLTVESVWQPDKKKEALGVFGSDDESHPGVSYLMNQAGTHYVGGTLKGLELPRHYDYKVLRDTPKELRAKFEKSGWKKVVAFQTRNPLHRAHQELTFRAARQEEANLLIHPVVGLTKPGDIDHYSRVRCYEHVLEEYPEQTTMLSLLPLAMRMAGPREALWHAIIRKNYGCTHFIVGRDHAGPGKDSQGNDFYGPYDAQECLKEHEETIGIKMVPFQMMVYVKERAEYLPVDEVEEGMTALQLSGTEVRRRLQEGLEIPDWFSYPKVVAELRKTRPPRHKQGVTVFFTGLSGAGKSTLANALMVKLLESDDRPVSLLDGDVVRKHLSSELGFSKEHRNINILRIGYVASEITKNGGFAICAPIAPYAQTRQEVREMVEHYGGFIEIHVATPIVECEKRDRKGLYEKARKGIIKEFTGISDPYEEPNNPEIRIDTVNKTPEEAVQEILLKLEHFGYIK